MKINRVNNTTAPNPKNVKTNRFTKHQNNTTNDHKKDFLDFENKIIEQTQNKQNMNKKSFATEIGKLIEKFQKQGNIETANKVCKRLAEKLVSLKNYSFAGIIYSKLIKTNPNNHKLREDCAQKAKKIANRLGDWVHDVARSFELKENSKKHFDTQDKYQKNLYKTKKYLTRVCNQYDEAKKRYITINRKIKPKETYQYMLAKTHLEIADLVKDKNPKEAIENVEKALQLFKELNFQRQEYIARKLLKQLLKK